MPLGQLLPKRHFFCNPRVNLVGCLGFGNFNVLRLTNRYIFCVLSFIMATILLLFPTFNIYFLFFLPFKIDNALTRHAP